jgi:hypothetical protein
MSYKHFTTRPEVPRTSENEPITSPESVSLIANCIVLPITVPE